MPGAHSKGRTLTVGELDACVGIENEIRSLKSTIDQTDLIASVAQTHYVGLGQIINAKRQSLDDTNQREIDDFNQLVKEHGEAVDAYNNLVTPLNDTIAAHTAATGRFNQQCAEIDYYETDLVKAYSIREKRIGVEMEKEKARRSGER